jgi:WD40 repeat protein
METLCSLPPNGLAGFSKLTERKALHRTGTSGTEQRGPFCSKLQISSAVLITENYLHKTMANEAQETILICAANPIAEHYLSLDKEVREIQNGLRYSRKHFDIRQQWATRPVDLRRALLDCRPNFVHFCGHGAGEAGIVLEGQLVEADALAELFRLFSSSIKCVVLNACYSAIQAHAIVRNIDSVVGMNKAIGDSAAIEFSTAFYDALGAGETVDFAFELGCNAIQLAGIPEHLTPVLLSRSKTALSYFIPKAQQDPTSRHDWDGAPAVSLLYGREATAELLKSWILGDACRLVLITGLGGVGKTDLATCLGRGGNRSLNTSTTLATGIQGEFEYVMWRSLLNAPPPEDMFKDLLDFLSDHRNSAGLSQNRQIEDIVSCLHHRRCLLILDNVEAILKPGDAAMRYRDGYEPYGAFFEHVAKTTHQSCLLLTSREKPRAIADLEGVRKPVRSLALSGIGAQEGRSLFEQIGCFSGSDAQWDKIVELYNGNPLALELAARHIDQVFSGDLSAFFDVGRPIFADIQELLNWHLDRLATDETELVYWLAIEREPVSIADLYDSLVSPVSRLNVTSTLQSLQRRIPLERVISGHFALQPVLMEHVTGRLVERMVSALLEANSEVERSTAGKSTEPTSYRLGALEFVNRYPLVKATAKENVRDSQKRLILTPIAERLSAGHGEDLGKCFIDMLDVWRQKRGTEPGYTAGNIIHLLAHLNVDLHGLNFSHLPIWQACLHDVALHSTDFSFADFRHSTFRYPFGTVFALAYSPNGELIAVGDDNCEIRLVFAKNNQLHARCIGHSDAIRAVAFSPDGRIVASASFDNMIRLWSTEDGRCLNVLLGHESWVYSIAFSPDGRALASASEDGTCRIWDLVTGGAVSPAVKDEDFLAAVSFSPDGRLLAVAGGSGITSVFRLPDVEDPLLLRKGAMQTARIRSLAFSPSGDILATGDEDHQLSLWRPSDGEHIRTLPGHSGTIKSISFSSSGDLVATASDDHTVRLWNIARNECVGQLHVAGARVWAVSCNPKARTLATGSEDGAVRMWDIDTCQCLTTLRGYSNKTWALAFAPEESVLVAGNEDGVARVWDIRDASMKLELHGHSSRVWAVACSPDGRWLASASDDLSVRLWDLHSGVCKHVMRGHGDWIRSVAFHPASTLLASAGEDGKVFIWDVATGNRVRTIEDVMSRIFSVVFCMDGTSVAAAGNEPEVWLFSIADKQNKTELKGHLGRLTAMAASGQTLATCSEDSTVILWDLKQLGQLGTLAVGSRVWCGAFSDRGASFLTGSEDGMLRRWAVNNGMCEAETRAHQGALWSLAVSGTEKTVATTGDDGGIRLWRLPDLSSPRSPNTLRPPRPYEGMNISGVKGVTYAQKEALTALGAFSLPST